MPRVWLKPTRLNPFGYSLLGCFEAGDILTAKQVLEAARPGLDHDFFHVYCFGDVKPVERGELDHCYGIAAFTDDENMLLHAPRGARDIYLRVEPVPLASNEMVLALGTDPATYAHLVARPPIALPTSLLPAKGDGALLRGSVCPAADD